MANEKPIKTGATTPTITELFNDVATAINNKTGNTGTIPATEFAGAIDNIHVLNGIDEIITPETPVAYYDATAEEPKQLDSEDSGNYLMYIDNGSGVTKTAYVGELESGAPYIYENNSLEEISEGVYHVYNDSGTKIESAGETTLNSSSYYQATSDDTVYYTGSDPLSQVDTDTLDGLYYLNGVTAMGASSSSAITLESGYYYYDGDGSFSSMSDKGINEGDSVRYTGSGFEDLYGLYYIDNGCEGTVSFDLWSGAIYCYNGYGSFSALDSESLYYIGENDCDNNHQKIQLPSSDGASITVQVNGHSYSITKLPDAE